MTHTRLIKAPCLYFPMIVFLNMKIIIVILVSLENIIRGWMGSTGSQWRRGFPQTWTCLWVLIINQRHKVVEGLGGVPDGRAVGVENLGLLSPGMAASWSFSMWLRNCPVEVRDSLWFRLHCGQRNKKQGQKLSEEHLGWFSEKSAPCPSMWDISLLFQRVLKTFLWKC